jgi:hypothetical protein
MVMEDHAATGLAKRLSVNAIFMVGGAGQTAGARRFNLLVDGTVRLLSMLIDCDLPDVTAQRYACSCVSHECVVPVTEFLDASTDDGQTDSPLSVDN